MNRTNGGSGEAKARPGHGAAAAPRPPKKNYRSGTHRAVDPAKTFARVQPYLPTMGITRIANVTGLDYVGIPVVMVCRPGSRSLAVSQGKGADLESAKVSGVMEAIEMYHAERIDHPVETASLKQAGDRLPVANIDQLPKVRGKFLDADFPVPWIEGRDLASGDPAWVPYELVHTNYTQPPPPGSGYFLASTNGLASGNVLDEAISHAMCELIERDALALLAVGDPALEDLSAPRLDLDSVDDPLCRDIIDRYRRAGIEVTVWDMTCDTGVASFFCRITESADKWPKFCKQAEGAGCHPAREVALLRALTEAAQSRLTIISGARDDVVAAHYRQPEPHDDFERLLAAAADNGPIISFEDVPTYDGRTFEDDVSWLSHKLASIGIDQIVVVDLTRAEFDLPVVRVVIPGLEGFSLAPHYCPGHRALTRRRDAS